MAAADPNYTFQLVASPVAGSVPANYAMVDTGAGYVTSTLAARSSRRSSGLSKGPAAINRNSVMQAVGDIPSTLLGAGVACPIRVGDDGQLERREVPQSGDDIVGWVETSGRGHVLFGVLPYNFFSGGGGSITLPLDLADPAEIVGILLPDNGGTGLELADLAGQAGLALVVNGSEDGFTFVAIPAGASVPTGTGFRKIVSGVEQAAAEPVDLADATERTGVLPRANQQDQTMAGQVTGTTGASVVAQINGATVPPAGALTTGNVLRVNGVGALTYAPVNLAGGANHVTGSLPLGNQAAPTGSGFATVTAGAWDAAATAQPLAINKGGTGVATLPGSDGELFYRVGGAFGATTNVTFAATRMRVGSQPQNTDGIGLNNGAGLWIRNAGNSADVKALTVDVGSNVLRLGDNSGAMVLQYQSTFGVYNGAAYDLFISSGTSIHASRPVGGYAGNSRPFCWMRAAVAITSSGQTLTPAQYESVLLDFTSSLGSGTYEVILPNQTGAYFQMRNACLAEVLKFVHVAAGAGVTVAVARNAPIIHCSTKYVRMGADVAD